MVVVLQGPQEGWNYTRGRRQCEVGMYGPCTHRDALRLDLTTPGRACLLELSTA